MCDEDDLGDGGRLLHAEVGNEAEEGEEADCGVLTAEVLFHAGGQGGLQVCDGVEAGDDPGGDIGDDVEHGGDGCDLFGGAVEEDIISSSIDWQCSYSFVVDPTEEVEDDADHDEAGGGQFSRGHCSESAHVEGGAEDIVTGDRSSLELPQEDFILLPQVDGVLHEVHIRLGRFKVHIVRAIAGEVVLVEPLAGCSGRGAYIFPSVRRLIQLVH